MLVGLLKPSSGEIFYNGDEIDPNSFEFRKLIGYVPQDLVLWKNLTVYETLHLIGTIYNIPNKVLKEKITHILEQLNLLEKRKELSSKLSGGMQRRLNLALGMIHDPDILFLDEVFIGLDPQSRVFLYDFLRDYASKENKTIILTSHLMEIVDTLSDRVCIIDNGKLLAIDTSENLKNTHGKGDILQLELESEPTEELLSKIETQFTEEVDIVVRERILEITILNAIQKLPKLIDLLDKEDIQIHDVKIQKQSLETVFIALTGKTLRED